MNAAAMPAIDEICFTFGLTDVEIEYSEPDMQNLTTYKTFQQHVRPLLTKENPKVPLSKLMMLVAAKWREFLNTNPHLQSEGQETANEAPAKNELLKEKKPWLRNTSKLPILKIKLGKRKRGSSKSDVQETHKLKSKYSDNNDAVSSKTLSEVVDDIRPKCKGKIKRTKKTKQEDEHQDYCEVCQQGGEIILCDTCPRAYHLVCLEPELDEVPEGVWSCPYCESESLVNQEGDDHKLYCCMCKDGLNGHCLNLLTSVPDGDWKCPRCSCPPLKAKVAKILTWRWREESFTSKDKDGKDEITKPKRREFFVKWHDLSDWHCSWVTELQLVVYHPLMHRSYTRKYDMEEPPKQEPMNEADAKPSIEMDEAEVEDFNHDDRSDQKISCRKPGLKSKRVPKVPKLKIKLDKKERDRKGEEFKQLQGLGDVDGHKSRTRCFSKIMGNREIRILMKYEFHLGVTTRQAVENINSVLPTPVATNATVARWFKRFRSGNFDLANEPRGRPETQVNNDALKATVEADPSKSARELALMLRVSKQTILTHLAQIGKVKKLDRWVSS